MLNANIDNDILDYNIQTILKLEIVHIVGKIDVYYFGYRILDEMDNVRSACSGYATDYEAMEQGIKELKKLADKYKRDDKKEDLPF